jgi:hypothetical protein
VATAAERTLAAPRRAWTRARKRRQKFLATDGAQMDTDEACAIPLNLWKSVPHLWLIHLRTSENDLGFRHGSTFRAAVGRGTKVVAASDAATMLLTPIQCSLATNIHLMPAGERVGADHVLIRLFGAPQRPAWRVRHSSIGHSAIDSDFGFRHSDFAAARARGRKTFETRETAMRHSCLIAQAVQHKTLPHEIARS